MKNIKMKATLVSIMLMTLLMTAIPIRANNDEIDGAFLEFLSELEDIDDESTHPVDFSNIELMNEPAMSGEKYE